MESEANASEHDAVRANYNAVGLAVMERLYSTDYLSIGGKASTDELAALAWIEASSTVLDIGSGLGGPALHLAADYGCHVTGLDLVEISVAEARERAAERDLSDRVNFEVGDATNLPFDDGSFSVVWGQDAWCHVPDTAALISEVARVLTPSGTVAFTDWVVTGSSDIDLRDRALAAASSPHMATAAQYRERLELHGLTDIDETDISDVFVGQYQAIYRGLIEMQDELTERFSERVFTTVRDINLDVLQGFESGDVGGVRIIAHRP